LSTDRRRAARHGAPAASIDRVCTATQTISARCSGLPAAARGRRTGPGHAADFYTRAAFHGGATLARHRIELTGFVVRSDPDRSRLARMVITCCAADARAVVASILTPLAAPRPDSSVTVAHTSPADPTAPMLRADTVTSVTAPDNPYD
jgi:hypothetical protein